MNWPQHPFELVLRFDGLAQESLQRLAAEKLAHINGQRRLDQRPEGKVNLAGG
jgi:hypothetical protein